MTGIEDKTDAKGKSYRSFTMACTGGGGGTWATGNRYSELLAFKQLFAGVDFSKTISN